MKKKGKYIQEDRCVDVQIFVGPGNLSFRTSLQVAEKEEEDFYKVSPVKKIYTQETESAPFVETKILDGTKGEQSPFAECLKRIDGVVQGGVRVYGFALVFSPIFHALQVILDALGIFEKIFNIQKIRYEFIFSALEKGEPDFDTLLFVQDAKEICDRFQIEDPYVYNLYDSFFGNVFQKEDMPIDARERYEEALTSLVESICLNSYSGDELEEISIPIKDLKKIIEYGVEAMGKKKVQVKK